MLGKTGKESTCNVVSVFLTFLFLSAFVVILMILIIFLHPQGKAHLPLARIGHKVSFLESSSSPESSALFSWSSSLAILLSFGNLAPFCMVILTSQQTGLRNFFFLILFPGAVAIFLLFFIYKNEELWAVDDLVKTQPKVRYLHAKERCHRSNQSANSLIFAVWPPEL